MNAIGDAIDKQMQEDGEQYFTDEKQNLYKIQLQPGNFDEFN